MTEQGEIYPVAERQYSPSRPTATIVASPERVWPVTIEAHGVVVQIFPGDAVILTFTGEATISMRAGQPGASLPLGRTQVTVRLDPSANARATEVGLGTR